MPVAPAIDGLAVLQFTGGTTGQPKATVLTHASLSINLGQLALVLDTMEPSGDHSLAVAPFAHITGFTAVLCLTTYMRSSLCYLATVSGGRIVQLCLDAGITYLVGPPTLLLALIDNAPDDASWALKHVISGGAPLPAIVKDRFEAVTGVILMNGYGLSETSPAVTLSRPSSIAGAVSAGRAMPGSSVTIVGGDGVVAAPGMIGEICVKGPQVSPGYWQDAAATAQAFRPDGFHTGDLGYLESDGQLFVVDRLKDIIIASGYNIYPANVENAICRHPAVAEVAVIGVPHPYRGETVCAVVVLREGHTLTIEALRSFLAGKLSPMEMPARLELRLSLPKSPAGKILRREVRSESA